MAKKAETSAQAYAKIISDLKQKKYKPIYFLDGDEPYYIDLISDFIAENVLSEGEKDFNQSIIYAQDMEPDELIGVVKRYPMMSEYQVVIVREGQNWSRQLERLEEIFMNPVPTTILVINYKGKKLDGRSSLVKEIKKNGVYFNSAKVREYEMIGWINQYCRDENIEIEPRAAGMLNEHIGGNVSGIIQAFDKLKILLPKGHTITTNDVSTHIGISKDFNIFELQKAIGFRDEFKALFIANYFANNQKDHHIILTIIGLYRYFNQLIMYHGLHKTTAKETLAKTLGVHPFFMGEFQQAAANYSPERIMNCIDVLFDIELKTKGVTVSNANHGQLVREMVGRLLKV